MSAIGQADGEVFVNSVPVPPSIPVSESATLTPPQQALVRSLVDAAKQADGVTPLSEAALFALAHPEGDVRHLMAYGDAGSADLVGYAQASQGEAELVVAPAARRTGVGTALLARLPQDVPVWAHGALDVAEAFGRARGLVATRDLHVLGRPLTDAPDLPPVPDASEDVGLPDGFGWRRFEVGRDEDEWLRVNAAAFRDHPEQGRWTRADLDERLSAPWFDPAGLLLVVPDDEPQRVAASHWTKVHPPGDVPARLSPDGPTDAVGEVFVLGVDPAFQGRGLARPATMLGLWHLARERGLRDVILYVDGDNAAALAVYRRLGFTDRSLDRLYRGSSTGRHRPEAPHSP